jgi:hypothetical protein
MRSSLLRRASLVSLLASLPLLGPACDVPEDSAAPSARPSSASAAESTLRRRFPAKAAAVLDEGDAFVAAGEGFARPAALRRDGLGVTLPPSGSGAVRFELPDGFSVQVREQGMMGVGASAAHAVAYERAGGASYWTSAVGGYEEWLRLDEGAASADQAAASWEIEGAAPVQVGPWVEVRNGAGTTRLRVTAPAAWTASGRPVEARLAVRASAIELWVDGGGEAVLVDPQWTAAAAMATVHAAHTGTLLQRGVVLAASGYEAGDVIGALSETYDPVTNS